MGVYSEQILPRIVDVACNMKEAHPQRRRVCEKLWGDVIEIGFGSGLNVPYYPQGVTEVTAVEPAEVGWKLAAKRLRETRIPVHRAGRRHCRFQTTGSMPRSRRGRCARFRTSPQRYANCAECSSPAALSISLSTASPPMKAYDGGSIASTLSSSESSAAVISTAPFSNC